MIPSRGVVAFVASSVLGLGAMMNCRASPDGEHALTGNSLWAVPLDTLAATRERPIFSPSRRPPSPPAVAAALAPTPPASAKPSEPERPPLSILGTVVGRSNAIGVFMEEANKNVLRLHAGQGYAGWILRAIKRRQANFEKGNAIATLSLPAPSEQQPAAPTASTLSSKNEGTNPASGAVAQVASSSKAPADRRRRD